MSGLVEQQARAKCTTSTRCDLLGSCVLATACYCLFQKQRLCVWYVEKDLPHCQFYILYLQLLWSIIVFSSSPRKRIHTRYPTMQFTSVCIGPNKQLQHHTSIVKKRAKPRALRTKIHGPLSATAKLLVLYHRTPLVTLDRIYVGNELSRP